MKDPQVIHACFTIFPKLGVEDSLSSAHSALLSLGCSYYIMGQEICPTTGRIHLQGYMQLAKKKRWSTLTKALNCHIEGNMKGSSDQNITYCKKDKSFTEWGAPKQIGAEVERKLDKNEFWKEIIEMAKEDRFDEILSKYPHQGLIHWSKLKAISSNYRNPSEIPVRRCIWIWSTGTGKGKSRWCQRYFPNAYWLLSCNWWQGYRPQQHDCVVWDDFDSLDAKDIRRLKTMSDRYPSSLNVKFGDASACYTRLIITSNYHPRHLWTRSQDCDPILRRFQVFEAINWNEKDKDLLVKKDNDFMPYYLGGRLIEENFF